MKFTTKKKRILAVVSVVAALMLCGSLAYAFWTSSGSGTGSATTGTSANFVVTSSAPTGGPLTPGGPTESVAFTVANPGTGTQNLTSVVVTVANADGSAWTAVTGCSSADYTVGTPAITYGSIAASGTASGTVSVTMNNTASNQNGCKSATVPLDIVAS